MIKIDISGDKAIQETFKQFIPKVQKQGLARLGAAIHDDVKQRIGKHTKSGALEQSLRWIKANDEHVIYNDLQRAPHARFVHWGTRPHVIRPKKRKALRWPVGGTFAFAKKVNHPGYEGDAYFVKAAAEAPRLFAKIVTQLQKEL